MANLIFLSMRYTSASPHSSKKFKKKHNLVAMAPFTLSRVISFTWAAEQPRFGRKCSAVALRMVLPKYASPLPTA